MEMGCLFLCYDPPVKSVVLFFSGATVYVFTKDDMIVAEF